jgi:DNA-binding CsgD family transcriptional regulator
VKSGRLPTLSAKERIVLELLVSSGPKYGLQLVDESRGRLKRGTVYVTLGRMEQKGLVESRHEAETRDPDALNRSWPSRPRCVESRGSNPGTGGGTMTKDDFGPGARLRRFAERTLDRDTLERVMLPALADLEDGEPKGYVLS